MSSAPTKPTATIVFHQRDRLPYARMCAQAAARYNICFRTIAEAMNQETGENTAEAEERDGYLILQLQTPDAQPCLLTDALKRADVLVTATTLRE